jgi:hypothetical protein
MIMDCAPMLSQAFVLRFTAEKVCTAGSRTNNKIVVEISSVTHKMYQ